MSKMTKSDQRRLIKLLSDRRKAGEALMGADNGIADILINYGVYWERLEYGLNSVFTITEPKVSESLGLESIEEALGYKLTNKE